jgi:hypothetical protein
MTAPSKESVSRWLPTVVALIAIVGNILHFGAREGRMEQRVNALEEAKREQAARLETLVPRIEYAAAQGYTGQQITRVEKAVAEVSAKLDRLIERTAR